MKALLDWKVVIALLIALFIAYAVFGGGNAGTFLEKAWSKVPSIGTLPIPSIGGSAVPVKVRFTTPVPLKPDAPVDIQLGDVQLRQFTGTITVANDSIVVQQAGSSLEVRAPLTNATLADFSMSALSVSGADFTILPNATATNATLELAGFHGTVTLDSAGTLLDGNVTSLRTSIGGRDWELK